ncbi:MAG TPA: efflux RND transporter periplasmic adaptor subunit [Negativicutes bacterium]|nr:efflux RND transporter periplasmic adaptor subunit [Negativicutes bacterium]
MQGMKWLGSSSFRLKLIGGVLLLSLVGLAAFRMGLLGGKPPAGGPRMVDVKALQVAAKDTPVTYEFVGEIEAFDSAQIRPKVTGNIVEKYVTGGAVVKQGQPLFRIEARQYETTVLSNDAAVAESESALSQARLDLARYKRLAANGAIAQQVLDNALALESQTVAKVEANRAKAQQARLDLRDTLVVSPIDGRIDIKDVGIGNYATAGTTTLATVSFIDKVRVKFSMSENEYLKLFARAQGIGAMEPGQKINLRLSDGQDYPMSGAIEQVDSGMGSGTGTMTLKALVDNPQKMLLPGMFARVVAAGEVRKDAIVIPQRAVQELLGKTFVTVVGEGEKTESRPVKMGPRVGTNWIVEEGLKPGDRVIVEGALKTPPGTLVKVTMING